MSACVDAVTADREGGFRWSGQHGRVRKRLRIDMRGMSAGWENDKKWILALAHALETVRNLLKMEPTQRHG